MHKVERNVEPLETVEPNESIFELQEVPGPVFALKQMGDTVRAPTQTPEQHHQ